MLCLWMRTPQFYLPFLQCEYLFNAVPIYPLISVFPLCNSSTHILYKYVPFILPCVLLFSSIPYFRFFPFVTFPLTHIL